MGVSGVESAGADAAAIVVTTAYLYNCFDFCLRSEIPLAELVPVADAGGRAIVDIRLGSVPENLPNSRAARWGLQVSEDAVLLTVAGAARYLVRSGREIVVDPAPDGSERSLRLFLLGSTLGILCHQRGLLPLHANAIVAGGGAYAFAGPSGAGKSTLAAHFSRAGYEILCDDVCVISFDEAGQPYAWPGLPRLKLWGDAAAAFGYDCTGLDRVIDSVDKYQVPLGPAAAPRAVPFRRLYALAPSVEGGETAIARLRGQQAMAAAMSQTYRGAYLAPIGLTAQNFHQCAALIGRAEIYSATRAWGYDVFEREALLLERHVKEAG